MSTLKSDAVTAVTADTALSLSGAGTAGVKISDYLVQTKGADVASNTTLTLGKDGNLFDVTGTTTITSIATQGIGSYVTLHFDGILTFTHHSTNLILPGAANITTAAGDIAVMYEYASADWRCVSYTKASGEAVVAATAGFTLATEQATTSGTSVTFGSIPAGTKMIIVQFVGVKFTSTNDGLVQIGDAGGIETSGYTSMGGKDGALQAGTTSFLVMIMGASSVLQGQMMLTLEDASNFTWVSTLHFGDNVNTPLWYGAGQKSLSAELTQVKFSGGTLDAGAINILYQ